LSGDWDEPDYVVDSESEISEEEVEEEDQNSQPTLTQKWALSTEREEKVPLFDYQENTLTRMIEMERTIKEGFLCEPTGIGKTCKFYCYHFLTTKWKQSLFA